MKAVLIFLALSTALFVQGCVPIKYEGESKPNISKIEALVGAPKSAVQEQLGLPQIETRDEEGSYFLYRASSKTKVLTVFWVWPPMPYVAVYECSGPECYKTHCLFVAFDAQDKVSRYEIKKNIERTSDCRALFLPFEKLIIEAEKAIPEQMYEIAWRFSLGTRLNVHYICRAAHQDYAPAQSWMGYFYRWGADYEIIGDTDTKEALLWYTLAMRNNDLVAKKQFGIVRTDLSPSEIEEVELRLTEWKPDPTQCDRLWPKNPT
jgi:hypothetical protein